MLNIGEIADVRVPLTVMDHDDPTLLGELLQAVENVARAGAFTGGPVVERFETAFGEWCETDYAVGVSSGTEALALTLRALDVGPGDEVVVPANSFIATAEAVSIVGAVPRFADVDPDTQLITRTTLEGVLGPRTRGVIPVHLFGRTAELTPIVELAREHGVWVVEDCAQAHGARFAGRRVGSWGDAGTYSFYPAKNLGGWGDGGAVVTNRPELADRVRLLRSHGERPRYHHRVIGTTGRLDAIQAAVLHQKLPRLEAWNSARRRVARELRDALADAEHIRLPAEVTAPADHVYHQFVIRTPQRAEFQAHLAAHGVASAVHYPVPIHRSQAFGGPNIDADVAPVATSLAGEICSLPIFPAMSSAQIAKVVEAVRGFLGSPARRPTLRRSL
jgi:dTDP-3-amino-3,4,6-trideoxy-alpha-D-glucose transaminase